MQNLVADGLLAAMAAPEDGGAKIAVVNPGGVRAALTFNQSTGGEAPGQVTYSEAYAVQPFGNFLVTMNLTGAQIDTMLEQQFIARPPRTQLVLGVSNGLTFDASAGAPLGSKVSNIRLKGTPIDPAATYRVGTNNFLADGGDLFTVFREGTNRISGVLDANGQVVDDLVAFVNYLADNSPVVPPSTDRMNELP
jgi:2',3'-cyclic-nucleotide 2'-phosphodiesterase (5'-nucleotidase family)